jgi:KDO2-lipid IV(A) lauroyltransferase
MKLSIVSAFFRLLSWLPLAWMHRIGWLLGRLFIIIPNRELRNTETNLELCFPELSATQRKRLRDRSLEQSGRTLAEIGAIWFWPPQRVMGLIRSVTGEEHLQRPPEQGLIVLSPHLGCWEIAGLYLTRLGETTSLYRPPKKTEFAPLIKQARERSGARLVPTNASGVKQLYRALQSGGITGVLPDQQPDSDKAAVFAPFFGVPALTMLLVNRLIHRTGAKVVFCYAERLTAGRGFHIHFLPASDALGDSDPQRAAAALNQGIETCVRLLPEQYQWSYKRFKDQPEGTANPY